MLDHCARGFNAETVAAGIEHVKDLPNVYFDTSSICEVMPMYTVLKHGGLDRVVFGTDFPLWNPVEETQRFLQLKLTDAEFEQIGRKTALRVLGEI